MGEGIDLAREEAPEHAEMLDNLKDQLLIVLVKELGGRVDITVEAIDDTGNNTLAMKVDPATKIFTFEVGTKH